MLPDNIYITTYCLVSIFFGKILEVPIDITGYPKKRDVPKAAAFFMAAHETCPICITLYEMR